MDGDSEKKTQGAGKPIALVGMTGCGKTTVGKKAAELLGLPFLDLDEEIVRENRKSIRELFSLYGEEGFRKIEQTALQRALEKPGGCVLSCGGGIVLREENRALLRKYALTVWIRRAPGKVLQNANVLERPPISGDKRRYYVLLRQRTPLYRMTADMTLKNRNAGETAGYLARRLRKIGF